MTDRLKDLGVVPATVDDMEKGHAPGDHENQFMVEFFKDVGRIKADMSTIRRNIKMIEHKHQQALTAISVDAGKQSNAELEELMDQTGDLSQKIRGALKKMEASHEKETDRSSAEARIRLNMQGSLSRKFMEIMGEYQDMQKRYKSRYRERVARQYKIVNPSANQEEINQVLEGGEGKSVFADKILTASHAAARNALADIQEKHQDILKLERSLEELHQLFVDMSILVESQGELLNQIEYSVEQSVSYVEKGVENLDKAAKYQKSYRKKMLCICVCLTVVLGIAAAVIFGVLKVDHMI